MSTSDLVNIVAREEMQNKTRIKKILENPLTFSLFLLFMMLIVNAFVVDNFFRIEMRNNLVTGFIPIILDESSRLIIVALGMTLVTAVAGGQDISVGSIMAISAAFCGLVLNMGEYRTDVFYNPLWLAYIVGLLGGALCGAFNGFLVAVLKIQPLIASLILFTAGRSVARLIAGQTIYIMNPVYRYLGVQIPGIPIRTTIIVSVVVIILVALIVKKTGLGLNIESIGINSSAARLVGINATRIKIATFIFCGILCAIAGMMVSSAVQSVNPDEIGRGIELDAILAVALGGTLLNGGKFSLAGTIIAAYTVQTITTSMFAMGVPADQLNVFKAVVVIIIIVTSSEVFKGKIKRLFAKRAQKKVVASNAMGKGVTQ